MSLTSTTLPPTRGAGLHRARGRATPAPGAASRAHHLEQRWGGWGGNHTARLGGPQEFYPDTAPPGPRQRAWFNTPPCWLRLSSRQ